MKKLLATLAAALLASLASAAQYAIQPDKSALTFTYRQMNVPVEGRFKKFAARIDFDPARPAAAKAEIDVDLASIDTGFPEGDAEVKGKNWFDVQNFSQAKFVATTVKSLGGNRYEAAGKMTIHGITRDATAPFTFTPQGPLALFDGAFVLKRADYGIGRGEWADFGTVANEVEIKFHFPAIATK